MHLKSGFDTGEHGEVVIMFKVHHKLCVYLLLGISKNVIAFFMAVYGFYKAQEITLQIQIVAQIVLPIRRQHFRRVVMLNHLCIRFIKHILPERRPATTLAYRSYAGIIFVHESRFTTFHTLVDNFIHLAKQTHNDTSI